LPQDILSVERRVSERGVLDGNRAARIPPIAIEVTLGDILVRASERPGSSNCDAAVGPGVA
jgi:hypothetical protein